MVRRLIAMTNLSLPALVSIIGMIIVIATGTIQVGLMKAYIEDSRERIIIIEREHKDYEKAQAQLLATQQEVVRRLSNIESHDVETRAIESKLGERLSKVEAK